MTYTTRRILTAPLGNNAFAWDARTEQYGSSPTLVIPACIDGTLDDVRVGTDIVFAEIEDGVLRSCVGLENFVRIDIAHLSYDPTILPVAIFDNHNHALYYWIEAMRK
jgi:hypothetical protein